MNRPNCKTEVSGLLTGHSISNVWSIACIVYFGANSYVPLVVSHRCTVSSSLLLKTILFSFYLCTFDLSMLNGSAAQGHSEFHNSCTFLYPVGVQRAEEDIEEDEGQQPEEEDSEDEDLIVKAPGVISDEEDLEDLEEEDDQEVAGRAKRAKVQQLHGSGSKGKPSTGAALTARQRSMQSSKEADADAVLSLIEFPGGLASPLGHSMDLNFSPLT